MNLNKILEKKRIIICCGSGGVGKTTIAASIALQAASQGRKTIVLTIDPAKRLATAMGLDELSNEPIEISLHPRTSGGRSPSEASGEGHSPSDEGRGGRAGSPPAAKSRPSEEGRLFAMMLDTKRTFDRLIEKYATDPETKKSIFNNQLYQHMSNMIAGSQEYMAMEQLYELFHNSDYDLLVLDTPPTRHALDFLEAPKKMMHLTSNSLLRWFLTPGIFAGKASRFGLGVLQKGAEKILSVFDRLAGFSFLHELSEMISLIGNLLGGFHDRAQAVYDLLRKSFVGFFLVTSPSSVSIQDALHFHQKIQEAGLPFLGFIMNRVHEDGDENWEKAISSLSPGLQEKVLTQLRNHEQMALRDQRTMTVLKKLGGRNALYIAIPLLATDVHDLEGLELMNKKLFS